MKKIFEGVLPKLFDFNKNLFGLVFGEANSQQSHDVLHTTLSLAAVRNYSMQDYRKIQINQIFEGLVRKNLERLVRYSQLGEKTDFTIFDAHYTMFLFVPLAMDFFTGAITTPEKLLE